MMPRIIKYEILVAKIRNNITGEVRQMLMMKYHDPVSSWPCWRYLRMEAKKEQSA